MATAKPTLELNPGIRSVLAGVRLRIRFYVLLEGISLAVIWLGLTFWLAFALDYLPILVGASEMPAVARGVMLAGIAGFLLFILYRYIGRRLFVPLHDRSMAVLLERRFAGLQDSLVTTVEMEESPRHAAEFNLEMLSRTAERAGMGAGQLHVGQVFNYLPLVIKLLMAVVLVSLVFVGSMINRDALELAAKRLYLLQSDPWPRSAHIEVVGLEIQHAPAPGETAPRLAEIKFENGVAKVAKGSSVALKVRALGEPEARVVPQACTIYYRALKTDGNSRSERGAVQMTNGRDAGGYRNFRFDGKPFKGVLSTLEFDVVGYDHRASGYRLEVVDSPAVISTTLDLTYPPYMVDEATSNYLPVSSQEYLPAGTFIPLGTSVTLKFRTNKDLRQAQIRSVESNQLTEIPIEKTFASKQEFSYRIEKLTATTTLEVSLLDGDGVTTDRPHKIFLTGVEDRPPQVDVKMRGIGTAVTPDAIVAIQGKIGDDYAVDKAWFDVQVNEESSGKKLDIAIGKGGAMDQSIDFRKLRSEPGGMELKPKDKLYLMVQAADRFNLEGGPHVGASDRYQLDVVTPEELLAMLEIRELGLRARFELTLGELGQLRDSLVRVKASLGPASAGADPEDLKAEDDAGKPLSKEDIARRAAELRLLRVQRGMQQSQKSAQEVLGISGGFNDIREELINNRVDTTERKQRLKELIADPLAKIGTEEFGKLDQKLAALEKNLTGNAPVSPETATAADETLEQTNVTIAKLEAVLQQMLDLETYNELLDIVRDLIKDQDSLTDKTKQERKRQAIEDLK
ncbi:MAG: hypothetical protein K8R36_18145 [Planctomycetales bacterium]|nr:hypothetical protein [Planctomycetales bacterium]